MSIYLSYLDEESEVDPPLKHAHIQYLLLFHVSITFLSHILVHDRETLVNTLASYLAMHEQSTDLIWNFK